MPDHATQAHSRELLERMQAFIRNGEYDRLEEVLHPDFVQEMPQSGERVVGVENFRQIVSHLPGAIPGKSLNIESDPYFQGEDEHYVMTPTFQVVKVEGTGESLTSYVKARYPDGSDWYIVTFSTFKDGKILKRVDFYAPFYQAPAWRAKWVEKL